MFDLQIAILAKNWFKVNTKISLSMNVNTLKLGAGDFPQCLSQIPSPPKSIYWVGQSPKLWLEMPKVAIVGSRRVTPYGKMVTTKLASDLAKAGVVIISGLAYGVDITAHQATLVSGGRTVAVLPAGLDNIYPAAHANLASQITESGCLITEYPSKTVTYPGNFIARNRLISGLADVVLITEAALKSGSLHTARFALEQGKTVMAVPGNITSPSSEGCNNLIRSGAVPVTSSDDVLFALGISRPEKKKVKINASAEERLVFGFIQEGITAQEEIARAAKLEGQELASVLTMLELAGHIRPAGGGDWTAA
jgi:DNA processing protein